MNTFTNEELQILSSSLLRSIDSREKILNDYKNGINRAVKLDLKAKQFLKFSERELIRSNNLLKKINLLIE